MRTLAAIAVPLSTGCFSSPPFEHYSPFEKADVAGGWFLSTSADPAPREIRFVFHETQLLVVDAHASADGLLIGWTIEDHLTLDGGEGCAPGIRGLLSFVVPSRHDSFGEVRIDYRFERSD